MPTLTFLHGFLGCCDDWQSVIDLLPEFKCTALSYPFIIPHGTLLVGYSMGGRIALSYPHPKIIISAHPGLSSNQARKQEEDFWILQLQTTSLSTFIDNWYAQPLFNSLRAHPIFPVLLEKRKIQNKHLLLLQLENHRLSEQPFYPPQENTFFLYGKADPKYASLLSLHSPKAVPLDNCGHACHLENPEACAEAIRKIVLVSIRSLPSPALVEKSL